LRLITILTLLLVTPVLAYDGPVIDMVDISAWQMAYTRPKFHPLLREYADAGLTGRIMFGSDGHDYAKAFAAYESAEFLKEQQLDGILCRNAERFLRRRGVCDRAD